MWLLRAVGCVFIFTEYRIRLCIFTSFRCVGLCCSMVASSTIRLWHIWTTNPSYGRSKMFSVFFYFLLLGPLSPCFVLVLVFHAVCPIRSLTHLLACFLRFFLYYNHERSRCRRRRHHHHRWYRHFIPHSFIHSSSIADTYTHGQINARTHAHIDAHFPFLLCIRFLFLFPPLAKNLFTFSYFFVFSLFFLVGI